MKKLLFLTAFYVLALGVGFGGENTSLEDDCWVLGYIRPEKGKVLKFYKCLVRNPDPVKCFIAYLTDDGSGGSTKSGNSVSMWCMKWE